MAKCGYFGRFARVETLVNFYELLLPGSQVRIFSSYGNHWDGKGEGGHSLSL
jgi:hypothetical protein